jgi:hypothetical protein
MQTVRAYTRLTFKRYSHLLYASQSIGIDVKAAEKEVESIFLDALPSPQEVTFEKVF